MCLESHVWSPQIISIRSLPLPDIPIASAFFGLCCAVQCVILERVRLADQILQFHPLFLVVRTKSL
jgi:hypothetical protein